MHEITERQYEHFRCGCLEAFMIEFHCKAIRIDTFDIQVKSCQLVRLAQVVE